MKTPLYDTRRNNASGIWWRGWIYEGCPKLTNKKRVMIVEDHGDYLVVSDYTSTGWTSPCQPTGEQYRVNRVGTGKPTKERLAMLQTAIKELQA